MDVEEGFAMLQSKSCESVHTEKLVYRLSYRRYTRRIEDCVRGEGRGGGRRISHQDRAQRPGSGYTQQKTLAN